MARVVMVGNFGLTRKGTMRARALPLARALARRGHSVTVFLPALNEPAVDSLEEGVCLRYIGAPGPAPIRLPLLALEMVWAAHSARPEILHAFKPISFAGLTAMMAAFGGRLGISRTRVVVDADDWEGTGGWATHERRPRWLRWLIDRQEGWVLRWAAALTVASRDLMERLRNLGLPGERLFYLPNGAERVDSGAGRADALALRGWLGLTGAQVVLLYTRFVEFPVAQVVDVFARVAERCPEARLLVVGKGFQGEEDALRAALAARQLTTKAILAGWVEPPELPAYLAAADVAVYPLSDTLLNRSKCPAKLVELMAAGVPVVAEAVGQAGEYIVDGESGYLVPPGDEAAFAAATVRLLGDEALRRRVGKAAAERIRAEFLWDHLAEVAERAYGLAASSGQVKHGYV